MLVLGAIASLFLFNPASGFAFKALGIDESLPANYSRWFWVGEAALLGLALVIAVRTMPRTLPASKADTADRKAIKGLRPFDVDDADVFAQLQRQQNLRDCLDTITAGAFRFGILHGESGCGKSSCGRSILRLVEPTAGSVTLDRRDVLSANLRDLRNLRREMQMIFQDPFASLNPQMQLMDAVAEPMVNYGLYSASERQDRVAALFDRVELPRSFLKRFPPEMSGGQRPRVPIVRALALNPKLIVADEAVSALDVSVQTEVLRIMDRLVKERGMGLIFISHDLNLVASFCDRVLIMYAGRIVETLPASELHNAKHPYTQGLLNALPRLDAPTERLAVLERDPAWATGPSVNAP